MKTHYPDLEKLTKEVTATDGKKYRLTVREQAASEFLFSQDGETKFQALRRFLFLTWPEFVDDVKVGADGKLRFWPSNKWNPWLERHLRAFTNSEYATTTGDTVDRYIGLTGCGGAGKTHAAGLYAVAWWAVSPENSIAILTSTTVGMIGHRIWPIITHFHKNAYDVVTGKKLTFGHMVSSMKELRAAHDNPKNAIFALAVAQGETQKAIHNLKGMHDTRMLLIVDEANGTPPAIFETIPNLKKGAQDVTVIVIGNPWDRQDPHGLCITPENGWGVFNEDLIEWRNKPVPGWQIESGIVLRFDGRDSPNVAAKKNLHPYIYTYDNWLQDNKPERIGTLQYWAQGRGMHPPEGMSNTIFNDQLFERCNADDIFTFRGERTRGGFLDPAFGGDSCKLQFGELGDVDGKKCLQLTDSMEVQIDPNAQAHDIDYQIARRVIQECKQRNIEPRMFGLDATGIGRGVGAIMASEWSPEIQYMNWGGSATERASAQNDGRPGREVYNNFVCELWFAAREAMEAGQLKGFTREAKVQFSSRTYEMNGKKYKIEPKPDMKERIRYSPDDADAVVGLLEVARRNGMEIQGKMSAVGAASWDRAAKAAQEESGLDDGVLMAAGGGWGEEDVEW